MILVLAQAFPPDTGGIQSVMGHLAEALGRSGEEVMVFADRVRDGGDAAAPAGAPYTVRRFTGPKPIRRRWKALAARRIMRQGSVTGIVADSWKSLEFLPRPGVPIVALAHGMEFPSHPRSGKGSRIRRSLAAVTAVAANSSYTADLVRAVIGDAGPPITVVNPAVPSQPEPTEAARQEAASLLADASPVLLTLARLEPRKGVDRVIEALPSLAARHPGLIYLVAGDGPDAPRLRALAAERGVAERVRFLGRVAEEVKPALLAAADLFAMPARREGDSVEGFGVVYLEAAWFGVPSLAGREGGAADAVRDGESGVLCDGADPAAVQDAIGRLLDDSALRRRLGDAARDAVRNAGGWDAVAARILGLLRGQPPA
ncbi:glycosyltransferase family 4 protein [Roseomonas sp. CCTCC AB2023176]|uniref:glycosyltransferase family 4 protein n=1 Tax=Roseomonas sp. CCTCC AB2023176 TaxID=3342640 RepID=UPI0035D9CA19